MVAEECTFGKADDRRNNVCHLDPAKNRHSVVNGNWDCCVLLSMDAIVIGVLRSSGCFSLRVFKADVVPLVSNKNDGCDCHGRQWVNFQSLLVVPERLSKILTANHELIFSVPSVWMIPGMWLLCL